jgi:hypothetical protein
MGCTPSKKSRRIIVKDYNNNMYDLQLWRSNEECCVCLDNNSNVLLLPCKHINMCDECACKMYTQKICPICQETVYSYNLLQIISVVPSN